MQTNQANTRVASPILDLIGAAPSRARPSEADPQFEALLEAKPLQSHSETARERSQVPQREPERAADAANDERVNEAEAQSPATKDAAQEEADADSEAELVPGNGEAASEAGDEESEAASAEP